MTAKLFTRKLNLNICRQTEILSKKAYHICSFPFRVLCETIKDFVAKVGKAHDEKSHEDDMSAKVLECSSLLYEQIYSSEQKKWNTYKHQFQYLKFGSNACSSMKNMY